MLYSKIIRELAAGKVPTYSWSEIAECGTVATVGGQKFYADMDEDTNFNFVRGTFYMLLHHWPQFEADLAQYGCTVEPRTRAETTFKTGCFNELYFAVKHSSGKTIVVSFSENGNYPLAGYIEE